MLNRNQEGLLEELLASERKLEPHLSSYEYDLLRICGPAYGGNSAIIEGDPENHWQEWLAIFLPQLVYGNPHCTIVPDNIAWVPERVKATEAACNTWGTITDIRHEIERAASDFAVRWTCGIVTPQPVLGYRGAEDPPYLPGYSRISPLDCRWDSTTKDIRKGRWTAHRIVLDVEDLLEEIKAGKGKGWDSKMVEQVAATAGPDTREKRGSGAPAERKQIVVWELWDREYVKDNAPSEKKGYFGTIFTVLDRQHATQGMGKKWVREPRPYFGPRAGPHIIQGSMLLGDLCEPLSPLVANTAQAVYLNKVARAIMKAVTDYKRGVVTNNTGLADKIEAGLDMSVWAADGVDVRQMVQQIEMGGLTQQLLAAKDDARQTLDRNSGLHEAQRGNVTGVATATEVQAANVSSQLRSSFLVQKFRDYVRQVYAHAAFYFDMDPDVVLDLGDGTQLRGGVPRQMRNRWSALDHERLAMTIDPYSMGRTDEQTKQMRLQMANMAIQTIASIPPQVAVAFNVPWYLNVVQEASGLRDMEMMVDREVFYAMQSQMLQLEEPVQPAPQRSGQPRFHWNSSSYANTGGGGAPGGSRAAGGKPAQTMKLAAPKPTVKSAAAKPMSKGA